MAVQWQQNFLDRRAADGQRRSHIPPMPFWVVVLRVAQLVLALLLVILTGYAASKLGSGVDGYGLTWWAFIYTLIYFVWLGVSTVAYTVAYHYWAHLAAESFAVLWWLVAWAVLASDASAFTPLQGNVDFAGDSFNIPGYTNVFQNLNSAINSTKAAAGLGALEWLLFIATLVFLVMGILSHRKTEAAPGGTVGTEAAPVSFAAGQPAAQPPVAERKPTELATVQPYPAT